MVGLRNKHAAEEAKALREDGAAAQTTNTPKSISRIQPLYLTYWMCLSLSLSHLAEPKALQGLQVHSFSQEVYHSKSNNKLFCLQARAVSYCIFLTK